MNILQEADKLVNGDRQQDYGHPIDDFRCIASMWWAYLHKKYGMESALLGPADVGIMMCMVKIAREANKHKEDNLVDLAGYAQTVQMVYEKVAEEKAGK